MSLLITSEAFGQFVKKYYEFLEIDYGFSITKLDDWSYIAETHQTRVHIYLEHYTMLVVEIEPIGEASQKLLRENIVPSRADIIPMSRYYNPALHYKAEMLDEKNFVHNVPVELERRANLLKTYFANMLRGDFSDWPNMEKFLP